MTAADSIGPKGSGVDIDTDRVAIGDINDEVASIIELSGVIKWFDVSKGYGFIVPDNGLPDILLHVTCLRRDGYQTAYEGARVVCEVLQRPKGLQAFRILSMDESTAIHSAQMPPARSPGIAKPTGVAADADTLEIVSQTGVHVFSVELAVTDEQRSRGLMERRSLPEGRGMLFKFEPDQVIQMWMHNTYIPLDMIFIRSDGR